MRKNEEKMFWIFSKNIATESFLLGKSILKLNLKKSLLEELKEKFEKKNDQEAFEPIMEVTISMTSHDFNFSNGGMQTTLLDSDRFNEVLNDTRI